MLSSIVYVAVELLCLSNLLKEKAQRFETTVQLLFSVTGKVVLYHTFILWMNTSVFFAYKIEFNFTFNIDDYFVRFFFIQYALKRHHNTYRKIGLVFGLRNIYISSCCKTVVKFA